LKINIFCIELKIGLKLKFKEISPFLRNLDFLFLWLANQNEYFNSWQRADLILNIASALFNQIILWLLAVFLLNLITGLHNFASNNLIIANNCNKVLGLVFEEIIIVLLKSRH